MPAYTRTLSASGVGTMCRMDAFANPTTISIELDFTGTATAKAQYSLSDVSLATDTIGTGMTWLDHPTLAGLSANTSGNIAFPVQAIRPNCTAWTNGNVIMRVIQAGLG